MREPASGTRVSNFTSRELSVGHEAQPVHVDDLFNRGPGRRPEFHVRVIDAPPSTSEAVPVTKDESSDAR